MKHPLACKNCKGAGFLWEAYDPSPLGISLSPGMMYDAEPCPKCFGQGICPWCGKHSLIERPASAPWEMLKERWARFKHQVRYFAQYHRWLANPWNDQTVWQCLDKQCGWHENLEVDGYYSQDEDAYNALAERKAEAPFADRALDDIPDWMDFDDIAGL